MRPSRVLAYARVSSEEQARGSSLGDQQAALKVYATSRGLTVDRFYVESESGIHEKFERREQIQLLMRDLRRGDLVLVDKIDRWSRDPEFTYRSVREIGEAGARVYFVGEQIDPSTSEGDSMLSFRVVFAREEHKRIKLRTVGTRKLLRDRGFYAEGLTPLGYERALPRGHRGPEIKNTLRVRDEDAALVREMFRRCIAGASIGDLRKWLTKARPARGWDKKTIATILRNRIYLGEIRDSRGVWIPGKHDPIVTAAVFSRAQDALTSRKLGGARVQAESLTAGWLLRSIGVCARCDAKLSAAYGGGTAPGVYAAFYYACRRKCGAPYVRVEVVDEIVAELVRPRLVEIRLVLSRGKEPAKRPAVDFAARRAALDEKRNRALEAYTDGLMPKDRLRATLAKVDAERGRVDVAEAEQARVEPLARPEVRREALAQVEILEKVWRAATRPEQARVLSRLAVAVRVEKDRAPVVAWRSVEELAGIIPETSG